MLILSLWLSLFPPPPVTQRWIGFEDATAPIVRRFEVQRRKPFSSQAWSPFVGWNRETPATLCRQNVRYHLTSAGPINPATSEVVWECSYRVPHPAYIYRIRACNNAGCSSWFTEPEIQCQAPTATLGGGCPGWFFPSAAPCPRSDSCP